MKKKSDSRACRVLAYNLQMYRQKHGLSQEKVAAQVMCHRTEYREIEAFEVEPSLPMVERLARGLGMSIADLLKDPGKDLPAEPVFRMPQGIKNKKPATKVSGRKTGA